MITSTRAGNSVVTKRIGFMLFIEHGAHLVPVGHGLIHVGRDAERHEEVDVRQRIADQRSPLRHRAACRRRRSPVRTSITLGQSDPGPKNTLLRSSGITRRPLRSQMHRPLRRDAQRPLHQPRRDAHPGAPPFVRVLDLKALAPAAGRPLQARTGQRRCGRGSRGWRGASAPSGRPRACEIGACRRKCSCFVGSRSVAPVRRDVGGLSGRNPA